MAARAGGRGRGRGRGFSSPHAPRPGGRSPAAASAGHDDSVYDFEDRDEDQDEDDHDAWPGTKAKTGGAKRSRVPTASAVAAADAAAKKPKKAQKVKKPAAKKQPIAAYESSRLELVASGAGGLTGRGRRNGVMLNLHAFTDGTPVTLAALATEVVDGLERSYWVLGEGVEVQRHGVPPATRRQSACTAGNEFEQRRFVRGDRLLLRRCLLRRRLLRLVPHRQPPPPPPICSALESACVTPNTPRTAHLPSRARARAYPSTQRSLALFKGWTGAPKKDDRGSLRPAAGLAALR